MEDQGGKPQVGRASLIMGASLLLSRVLGIVRDMIMTAQFGRNEFTDAYSLAFVIPDLLFFLIAGGALSSAFIPVFSEYLHTDRKRDAWHVFSSVTTIMAAALLVMIVLVGVYTEPLLRLALQPEQHANIPMIAQMSRIVLPAQFAFFLGGLMFGTLYAHQRFSIPGLGPNVYNIGIILGALILSHFVHPGIAGMAWGALIGAFVGNFFLPAWEMRKIGVNFKMSFDTKHPGVRKVFVLMLPVVFGLSLPGVYGILMRYFGSGFVDGIVTSLDLSNKLMQAPLGVFGQSFAIAVFPALSQFFAQDRMDMFREQIVKTMRTALYISIPISIYMAVMAPDIVNALFGYGKGAKSDPTALIVCLRLFCLGIPAWCMHPILMRGYFAMQKSVKPIVLGTATTVVFIGLAFALLATPLSFMGLPLASSLSAIFLAILMTFTLRKDAKGLELRQIGKALDQSLLAGVAMCVLLVGLCLLWAPAAQPGGYVWSFTRLIVFGFLGMGLYTFITKKMGMPETATIDRALAKMKR
ncbi:MAG: murein biosynthesis integral membrane protein MurJ [Chthonomonas sp.]|nr:murein biosynthesis integral membrane protein MurJ [Chthonomonas sp.]